MTCIIEEKEGQYHVKDEDYIYLSFLRPCLSGNSIYFVSLLFIPIIILLIYTNVMNNANASESLILRY